MKIIPPILAVLFVGIVGSTSFAQTKENRDAGSLAQDAQHAPACPSDMVEIEGDYCPNVEQKCLYNTDANGKRESKPANPLWACGEFQSPTVCKSNKKVHMHFCIDRYEWPNKQGQIPQDWMSWYDAKKATASVGKRLCTHREWTLAAEGPNMHPLPYGDGFHRDSSVCNFDRHYSDISELKEFKKLNIKSIDVFRARRPNDTMSKALRLFLVPSGSKPNCVSDYGVYDMAGNIDEWVVNEGAPEKCSKGEKCYGYISGLMGGHVWHVRNASRPMTTAHGPVFSWYETGTRACKDIE